MVARANAVVKSSKSAQRRQRRKERDSQEEEPEQEEEFVDALQQQVAAVGLKPSPNSVSAASLLAPAAPVHAPAPAAHSLGLGAAPAGIGLAIPQRELQPALWGDSLSASPYLQSHAQPPSPAARFPTAAGQTPIGYEKPAAHVASTPAPPPPALNFTLPSSMPPMGATSSGVVGADGRYVSKSGFSIRL
jgi:hypothetical protein